MIDLTRLKDLLCLLVNESVHQNRDVLDDLDDAIDDISSCNDNGSEFDDGLAKLADALAGSDKRGAAEAIVSVRLFLMDLESGYSTLSDLMSGMADELMDSVREEASQKQEGLKLEDVLSINNAIELGTFMDDLNYKQSFNFNKFDSLVDLMSKNHGCDADVVSAAFSFYSELLIKISFHFNPNDGFLIKNINGKEELIYDAISKFESEIKRLTKKL